MFEVRKTDEFDKWLTALQDQRADRKDRLSNRAAYGLVFAGDIKLGKGVSEMRLSTDLATEVLKRQ